MIEWANKYTYVNNADHETIKWRTVRFDHSGNIWTKKDTTSQFYVCMWTSDGGKFADLYMFEDQIKQNKIKNINGLESAGLYCDHETTIMNLLLEGALRVREKNHEPAS